MQQYNKYIKQWQDLCIQMNEAMQKDDFTLCDKLMNESKEAYEKYKECSSYPDSNRKMTFGELNYMLECELPNLFKNNEKALKECTKVIKEDKNLLAQFKFIDALRKYDCDGNTHSFVTESVNLVSPNINRKTLQESLNKFADTLAKYEIGGYQLDEEAKQYYKNCEILLKENKKITNLKDYTNSLNAVADYINEHKQPLKKDVVKMAEDLEKKIANLSEEEQRLVQDIIDFKQPMVEAKQEKLFNQFKNECLHNIECLKETASEEEIEGLKAIEEQLENKTYCKESIVQDIAKLLEIRDILNEK